MLTARGGTSVAGRAIASSTIRARSAGCSLPSAVAPGSCARCPPTGTPAGRNSLPWSARRRMVDEAMARPATEVPPRAVSITQGTEASTVYSLDEIRAIVEVARARRLLVHMDGARLANAVARLGCTPAEATWKWGSTCCRSGPPERGADRGGGGVLQPRAGRERALPAPARGAPLLQDALPLRPARRDRPGRPLAPQRPHTNLMAQRIREGLAPSPACASRAPPTSTWCWWRCPSRCGRARGRRLQLLAPGADEGRRHPHRVRLRHPGGGGRRAAGGGPPPRRFPGGARVNGAAAAPSAPPPSRPSPASRRG